MARINRELPGDTENSLVSIGQKTFQALVMQALQLRRIYREVFILRDIRGHSTEETAAILGIDADSVARRLTRARVQLGLNGNALPTV